MFIYFCGSIRGGRQDAEVYAKLIEKLQSYGTVLTEHIGNKEACEKDEKELGEKDIHDRDMKWLNQSEVVVAEVTQPSLGVGYELGRAIEMDKKVLCLFRLNAEKKLSAMIRGADNEDGFLVKDYKLADVDDIFSEFFGGEEQKNGNNGDGAEKEDDDSLDDEDVDGEDDAEDDQ